MIPRNFSSIPDPSSTTSTTPTSSSARRDQSMNYLPGNKIWHTCNDRIECGTPQEHTGTDKPAPRWGIMSTVSSSGAVVYLLNSRSPEPPRASLSLLVPQRANRGNRNSTSEILTTHALRKGSWLETGILNCMINGLEERSDSRCQQRWLRNPTVRCCCSLYSRFGSRLGGWHRNSSALLTDRLRVPENRRNKLLVDGGAVAYRSRNLRVEELLRVLPDLGGMGAKREPQPDEVRLGVTRA